MWLVAGFARLSEMSCYCKKSRGSHLAGEERLSRICEVPSLNWSKSGFKQNPNASCLWLRTMLSTRRAEWRSFPMTRPRRYTTRASEVRGVCQRRLSFDARQHMARTDTEHWKKRNTAIFRDFRGFSTHRWAKTEVFETKRRPRGSQFVLLGAHHGQLWRVREPGFLLKHVGSWAMAHVHAV